MFEVSSHAPSKAIYGLSLLPVPATKALWFAQTEAEWQAEYEIFLKKREDRTVFTYGDVLTLHSNGNMHDDPRMKDLNDWYTSMDSFGILVLMAANSTNL
jgi:hypothetical protein